MSCKPAEPSSPPLPSAKTRTSLPKKRKAPLPKEESNSESDDSDENQAEDIKKVRRYPLLQACLSCGVLCYLFAGLFGSEELSRTASSCLARPGTKVAENCH